jgi:basic amino acid/polyamine antiporter, APA family
MARALQKTLTPAQFFTMSFGCIIGVGWVIALPNWLREAGPGGAALAFLVGALAMMLVGVCYAELATALPVTGGEVAYAYFLFGPRTSFATGWFLALSSIATTAFEAISLGWVAGALVPGLEGPPLYSVAGAEVRAGSLALGVAGTLLLTWLNYRGAGAAALVQDVLTWGLLATSIVVVLASFASGSVAHLQPLFSGTPDRPFWRGILTVMATAPFWYAGFDVIPQLMGERAPGSSLRKAGAMIMVSIAVAAAFYVLVILACSMVMPWTELVRLPMPAVDGFRTALHSEAMARTLLAAALLGLVTTWNTVFLFASRVLFTLGHGRLITARFADVHPAHGSPSTAVVFVGLVSAAAVLLGRGALMPIVNVAGVCLAGAALLICIGVVRFRRTDPAAERPYRVPGGEKTAVLAAVVCLWMVVWALVEPGLSGGLPLEWLVLGGWGVLGAALWLTARRTRKSLDESERRRLLISAAAKEAV